jgi:hypothetical protein
MLRTDDFIPFAAPSTAAFGESEEHRKQAATGRPFLWLLSFGRAKESNSPSGAMNPIK